MIIPKISLSKSYNRNRKIPVHNNSSLIIHKNKLLIINYIRPIQIMLRQFISLKPNPSPTNSKLKRHKKTINILTQAIQQLFRILDFLCLDEILLLYKLFLFSKQSKDVEKKIQLYWIVRERKYSRSEESKFLAKVTQAYAGVSIRDYSKQNNLWKQPICLDIERTHADPLASTGMSDKDFKRKKIISMKDSDITRNSQKKPQSSSSSRHISSTKPNLLSIKFNFLIFSCDQQERKQQQSKSQQEHVLKNYLKSVLNAISNRNNKIGYVQGLNFWIKHMFQCHLTQQQAFIYSCFLLEQLKCQQLFTQQLKKSRQLCYVFDVYLYNNLPQLYYLMKLYEVESTVYASNWWITLFSQQLPKRVVNKIWRLFVIKGWKVLIKFGLAVMCFYQQKIKKTKPDEMFCFMRNILSLVTREDQHKLWPIMSSIKVSNKMIAYLSQQMTVLSNDTEIQLWRLQHQKLQLEKAHQTKFRRFSFCQSQSNSRPTLTRINLTMSERKILDRIMIEEEQSGEGCCASFGPRSKTEAFQQQHSLLSMCRSVNYQ